MCRVQLLRVGDVVEDERVVPCHWGTFPLLKGTPDELKQHAAGVQVDAVDPGGSVTL